jgi:hypothetical protein
MIEMYPAIDAAVLQPFFPEISRLVFLADCARFQKLCSQRSTITAGHKSLDNYSVS